MGKQAWPRPGDLKCLWSPPTGDSNKTDNPGRRYIEIRGHPKVNGNGRHRCGCG